jgi:hypothetical protein
MKLRFSSEDIRIRVTCDEFEQLARGGSLALEVQLPHLHVFRLAVRTVAVGDWMLESDPTGLWLSIPQSKLNEFAQALPSREGMTYDFHAGNGKATRVVFEVDLHS